MQVNKNIKIFLNYFLGPLLFAWLSFSIYHHIRVQPGLEESWQQIRGSLQSSQVLYLVAACVLIIANWGLEAWKWKISVATVHPVSFVQAFKAVLSGVTFSVSMPNRIGEYLGRVLYLPEGSRLKTISVTLVGSFAQLLATLFTGAAGLIVLKKPLLEAYPHLVLWYQFILYGLLALLLVLSLLYFNVSGGVPLFHRWIPNKKYHYLVEALASFDRKLLLQVWWLSLLRYFVFAVQYILVFYVFEVQVPPVHIFFVMSVVFLALAIIPSITLVEIGVRGEVSLRLMGLFSSNALGIGLTSITIWFINLVLPAMVGSLLMLNLKMFRRRKGNG